MYSIRTGFFRQLFIAFLLIVGGWMLFRNGMNTSHGGQISIPEILVACVCWWLSYRAIRNGFRVLSAQARVAFGND
jgi:hypothetical protein